MPKQVATEFSQVPRLAPVFLAVCFAAAIFFFLTGASDLPWLMTRILKLEQHAAEAYDVAIGIAVVVALGNAYDNWRRRRLPVVPGYLRANRALSYGLLLSVALEAYRFSLDVPHLRYLLTETKPQLMFGGVALLLAVATYALSLHPLVKEESDELEPYQLIVEKLRNTYEFVLGIVREGDFKLAAEGKRSWLRIKEDSLWTNLLVLGGIGSGKTSALAYPLIVQALGKYPHDDAMRPSLMLMDLKGDNALRLYEIAKRLGREKEFFVIRPGNELTDAAGKDLIPKDRFLRWNPVGGDDPADLRSLQLLDGLEATNKTPSHQYWYDVESEFLQSTLSLMDLVKGHGVATLYDLYYFGLNAEYRNQVIGDRAADGSMAQLYFKQRFNKLDSEQQSHLISGLAAKLSRLATETLQSTFCPAYGDSDQVFEGFLETLADRPGILVFSVPEATYSQELARLLGVSFLRAFQTQMLRRTDSAYGAKGGNTKRLVLQVTDECWAYMNRGIASFTAVARQARVCNVFLSQSLDQLHDSYRDTIVGNFRSKALLGVNDELTLKTFSNLFGEMKETFTTESLSENLQDVRHGVYTERMKGRSQGVSRSQNTSERIVPRFSQTEIQHLPPGRMIVHLYDGQKQHDATAVETTPYFRLTYHLLHPLAHPDIRCKGATKAEEHTYRSDDSGGLVCTRCDHRLAQQAKKELEEYRAVVRAA